MTTQNTLEHIQTMFPLFWWRQKGVLKLLNEEQRKHHRELQNPKRKQRTGEPGDIITGRKQVQSNAPEGLPAKLVLRTKGPYGVLEKVLIDSYHLQKIPGTTTMRNKRKDPNQSKNQRSECTRSHQGLYSTSESTRQT